MEPLNPQTQQRRRRKGAAGVAAVVFPDLFTAILFIFGFLIFLMALAALILAGLAYVRQGAIGPAGTNGTCADANCTSSFPGVAEFVYTTQSPNNPVAPGVAFTISTQVYNDITTSVVASAAAGGTVFTLTAGLYLIDYETSLDQAASIALYKGASAGSLAIDTNTIAGSSTATTWIHGRAVQHVTSTLVIALSSVVGSPSVVTAGTATGEYVVRLTIMQLA